MFIKRLLISNKKKKKKSKKNIMLYNLMDIGRY